MAHTAQVHLTLQLFAAFAIQRKKGCQPGGIGRERALRYEPGQDRGCPFPSSEPFELL